jgi:hypothetical protein
MSYVRVLTDAQIAWVRAIQAKQYQFRRAVKHARLMDERIEARRQLALLPTVIDQAEHLGVHPRTILRVRTGHEYVAKAPSVPREPTQLQATPCSQHIADNA